MKHRYFNLIFALALVILAVSPALSPARAQGVKRLLLNNPVGKGDFTTADPALVTDWASNQISQLTFYDLVRGLETDLNKIQPGMAEKWDISKDGLTYTFTIRQGVPWVMWDGKQVAQVKDASGKLMNVTAHDFEYGLKRTLDPRTASQYAYVFTSIIKGAAEFNGSKETGAALDKLRDAVGLKAENDSTLVITLKEPAGYALSILTLTNAAAQPQAVIEKFGDKWTEPGNMASYGPFVISEWKHDDSLTLSKNPFWPGIENSPKPKIDEIKFSMLDESAVFSNYEAGTTDIATVPVTEIDRVRADSTLSKELFTGPIFSSGYYGYNVLKPPFDNVHMRRAFSMAIDRKALVDSVTKVGEPAHWFSRPGISAAPTLENSPKLGVTFDPEGAKKELQAYLDEKKITADQIPPITLVSYQVETVTKTSEAMQQMWQETLGIHVDLAVQEVKVLLGTTLPSDPPQIYALGWSADYPDANNFLREVFHSSSGNNFTKWKNADYDKLVDDAAKETDPAKRLDLYRQAEDILIVKDAVIIPTIWRSRIAVTKPYVDRTFSLINGDERIEKWDIKAH